MRPAINSRLGREITVEAARLMRWKTRRAMRLLERCQPCPVAQVLTGTAGPRIPRRGVERALRIKKQKPAHLSALKFMVGDMDIVLTILPLACKNAAPIDPVSDRARRRANPAKIARPARR